MDNTFYDAFDDIFGGEEEEVSSPELDELFGKEDDSSFDDFDNLFDDSDVNELNGAFNNAFDELFQETSETDEELFQGPWYEFPGNPQLINMNCVNKNIEIFHRVKEKEYYNPAELDDLAYIYEKFISELVWGE